MPGADGWEHSRLGHRLGALPSYTDFARPARSAPP